MTSTPSKAERETFVGDRGSDHVTANCVDRGPFGSSLGPAELIAARRATVARSPERVEARSIVFCEP